MKLPPIYRLWDRYDEREYFFLDRKQAKRLGEQMIYNESDESEPEPVGEYLKRLFADRFGLYKIRIEKEPQ